MRAAAPIRPRLRHGFTLLELVLALLVFAIVMIMVFRTQQASMLLGQTVVNTQNEEGERKAMFELLGKMFGTLPGNARMELASSDAGARYLSDLTLQNVPLAFTWGGTEKVAKAVKLSTVPRRDGFIDIVLYYYEEEILQDSDNQQTNESLEPFAEVVLLEDVRLFEWEVLDGRTMEWAYDWDLVGRLPLQMKLTVAFGGDGEVMNQIFWIPPKQDPEVMMRQLQQQQRGGGGGGGGPQQPGGGIDINVPGGGGGPRGGQGGGGGRENGGNR